MGVHILGTLSTFDSKERCDDQCFFYVSAFGALVLVMSQRNRCTNPTRLMATRGQVFDMTYKQILEFWTAVMIQCNRLSPVVILLRT
jgi:hypothetical protein